MKSLFKRLINDLYISHYEYSAYEGINFQQLVKKEINKIVTMEFTVFWEAIQFLYQSWK